MPKTQPPSSLHPPYILLISSLCPPYLQNTWPLLNELNHYFKVSLLFCQKAIAAPPLLCLVTAYGVRVTTNATIMAFFTMFGEVSLFYRYLMGIGS